MSQDGETFEVSFARVLRHRPDGSWEAVAWLGGERVVRAFGRREEAEGWLRSLPPAVVQDARRTEDRGWDAAPAP